MIASLMLERDKFNEQIKQYHIVIEVDSVFITEILPILNNQTINYRGIVEYKYVFVIPRDTFSVDSGP